MGAQVLTYMFLVLVTLKLQQTSAQCAITLDRKCDEEGVKYYENGTKASLECDFSREQGEKSGSSQLVIHRCSGNRNAGAPASPGPEGEPTQLVFEGHEQTNTEFRTKDWAAEALCKSAPRQLKSGTYYFGPPGKPIRVYCNMATQETCIRTVKTTPEFNHDPSKGAFWLNEENVHLTDLYAGISVEQLTWLRNRAVSVRQTLKYNCLDSVPYSKYNMSSSVLLWAWNDGMIGPYPTEQSPIFYSIPEATDKCVEGSTEWKSSIIELQSSDVYRLPIADVWIGDIRNEKQKVTIESVELCFG